MATLAPRPGAVSAKIEVPRERYSGWLDVSETTSTTFDSYRTEGLVEFSSGWTELRRFRWSRPLESVWHTGPRGYFLSLVLDGPESERRNMAPCRPLPCGGRRVRLVPPNQTICSVSPEAGEARSMRCFIDADFVESICTRRPSAEEREQLGVKDFSGGAIEWLLFRMYRELDEAGVGLRVAVDGIAHEIAVELARTIERGRRRSGRYAGGLPSWRMRLMVERAYADGPLPKVGELAQLCGMTPRHLGRTFLAETGQTIGRFIAAAMVERASEMLRSGTPVNVVAEALGYAKSSSLAHAFYRETGVLPSSILKGDRLRSVQ